MFGTGMSDENCRVELRQAIGGGWFANYGHFSTPVFRTPRECAEYANRHAQNVYGSTIRLIDLTKIR